MSIALDTTERTLADDLRAAVRWHREVCEDLIGSPSDPELLAEEELLAILIERLEHPSD